MSISAQTMSNRPNDILDSPDPLSVVLSRLQLSAEIFSNGEYFGQWSTCTTGSRRIPFHLIGRGKAWLHIPGREKQMLSAGDLVVLPHDNLHHISSSSVDPQAKNNQATTDTQDISGTQNNVELNTINENNHSSTQMICGFFDFQNKAAWPLLNSLPEVIVLDLSEQSFGGPIRILIELLINELKTAQPGFYNVINQLAYLLFVQVIRSQIDSGKLSTGLLAALFDEKISKALSKIHAQPGKNWSVESLAQQALMGRSAFSQRFNALVGMPAMQYLTAWRMQEAKQLLTVTTKSVLDIALQCGYESEAAFRKSYKKVIGEPPGMTRQQISQ
jgi:AraC family transcriptional activator of mtrCDE